MAGSDQPPGHTCVQAGTPTTWRRPGDGHSHSLHTKRVLQHLPSMAGQCALRASPSRTSTSSITAARQKSRRRQPSASSSARRPGVPTSTSTWEQGAGVATSHKATSETWLLVSWVAGAAEARGWSRHAGRTLPPAHKAAARMARDRTHSQPRRQPCGGCSPRFPASPAECAAPARPWPRPSGSAGHQCATARGTRAPPVLKEKGGWAGGHIRCSMRLETLGWWHRSVQLYRHRTTAATAACRGPLQQPAPPMQPSPPARRAPQWAPPPPGAGSAAAWRPPPAAPPPPSAPVGQEVGCKHREHRFFPPGLDHSAGHQGAKPGGQATNQPGGSA